MTRDEVSAICLSLPAAEETYPVGEAVAVITVGRTSGTGTPWTWTARSRTTSCAA